MKNKDIFFDEIRHFLALHFDLNKDVVDSLIKYQDLAILDPQKEYPINEEFEYNIHQIIYNGEEISKNHTNLSFQGKNYFDDFFEYGKETLWWGRRIAACKTKVEEILNV